ncbi:MAG: hypothetical protein ACTSW1_14815 [Candidatus Hodarchaeales archaeon]
MKKNILRFLLAIGPFITLFIVIIALLIINKEVSSPYDSSWKLRQFVLAIFIIASTVVIPNLLHLHIFFVNKYPVLSINLQHHPPLLQQEHEILFKGKYYCAGCTGSIIGLLLTQFLLILYFFFPNFYLTELSIFYLVIGSILVIITFTRYFIEFRPTIRLVQHTTLFPGIAFLIISLDLLAHSAFIMIILLPLWLLFIVSRIYLSEIDHSADH